MRPDTDGLNVIVSAYRRAGVSARRCRGCVQVWGNQALSAGVHHVLSTYPNARAIIGGPYYLDVASPWQVRRGVALMGRWDDPFVLAKRLLGSLVAATLIQFRLLACASAHDATT